ncbi:MAG: lipopolysaccharide heptosyltransferase II [Planctomycetes bacterium HGW-Planctomycetes-1]|nr:MAG: lipopolysaccharide heptosyltransferase II [Planctomycetes bacterium HGW-Planctomycetes-1]
MSCQNILVWLPSPMGDAVMATPALRCIRNLFENDKIFFCANDTVAQVLADSPFADEWITIKSHCPFAIASELKKHNFDTAILFKNSFASALAVFLAGVKTRIGYARDGRGIFLTEKLFPPKIGLFRYKPLSALDYYLAVASWLGADVLDRKLELSVNEEDKKAVIEKFGEKLNGRNPFVILVPGGAFGPSKIWPEERFAQTADFLIEKFSANVFVSVSPVKEEIQIAEKICSNAKHPIVNLGENPVTLGQLKALFPFAELVITNDTGPRHIAIALGRKIITLFGPNNPVWTENNYPNEVKIIADVPCAPCDKPVCKKDKHYCMESITANIVCQTAEKFLAGSKKTDDFAEISLNFTVRSDFVDCFSRLGLENIDDVFNFAQGKSLTKPNLASFRERIVFDTQNPTATLFLKRYQNIPKLIQLKNRLARRKKISMMACDNQPAEELRKLGINTPRTIAFGEQWQELFEKRSFIITEKIPDASSLEENLPLERENFIENLAAFVRKFHDTGFRHRDLYLCHIFCDSKTNFTLIDLNRVFKPLLFSKKYLIKDLAQLYYSAPGNSVTEADWLKFFLAYWQKDKLSKQDELLIKKIKSKARKMAKHDKKHNRTAPFEKQP